MKYGNSPHLGGRYLLIPTFASVEKRQQSVAGGINIQAVVFR